MFVGWQSRQRARPAFGQTIRPPGREVLRAKTRKPDVHWAAILVEAVRIDGRPKQQHVAYLGGITDSAIEILPQRCYFWESVTKHLDQIANRLSPDQRQGIETAIARRVPLPTPVEFVRALEKVASIWGDPADQQEVLETRFRAARMRWPWKQPVSGR